MAALEVASAELDIAAAEELLRLLWLELDMTALEEVASAELDIAAAEELLLPCLLELETVALEVASAELVTAAEELLLPCLLELETAALSLALDPPSDALEMDSSTLELLSSLEELEEESSQALNVASASAVPRNNASFFLFIIPAFVW